MNIFIECTSTQDESLPLTSPVFNDFVSAVKWLSENTILCASQADLCKHYTSDEFRSTGTSLLSNNKYCMYFLKQA